MGEKAARKTLDGARGGALAGVAAVAAMYLLGWAGALTPLPEALQRQILDALPGPVFGFLIDTLQHWGKMVEEVGLILLLLICMTALGAVHGLTSWRWGHHLTSAAACSVAGWALVVVGALPLAGEGLFGLSTTVATPFLWALVFLIYAVVLVSSDRAVELDRPEVDRGRRRLLAFVPWAAAALGFGVLSLRLAPGWYRTVAQPPEERLRGAVPEITPAANFYVVSEGFSAPSISSQTWTLRLGGLVERPLSLSYQTLRALPPVSQYVTLECISNTIGGKLISTGAFTGASLRDLVTMASPRPEATTASFKATDGYTEFLPLDLVMRAPEILVAYELNGATLAADHGYPARLLVPGRYGMKGPKWLEEITLTAAPQGGFWEAQGWDRGAEVQTMARFDVPVTGSIIQLGPVHLAGVAYAGMRGISRVEFTDGDTWVPVRPKPSLSGMTWSLWRATWLPRSPGSYTLQVRALDSAGEVQSGKVAPSFPAGATGYHSIDVVVVY